MDLRTHLKLAAVSLAVACVLWLGVHNEDRITIPLTVPVTYQHPSEIVRLVDAKEVIVRIRASRKRLATVSAADVSVIVRNPEGLTGSRLELLEGAVQASFGIQVDSVEPARIQVDYDRLSSRSVPVEVRWSGEPADGWRVDETATRAEPDRVQVLGPSRLLAELEGIPTLPIDVAGAKDSVRSPNVQLQPPGSLLSLAGIPSVAAVVPVIARIGTRTFPEIPIHVLTGEWETSAPNPPRLAVRLEGPLPSLGALPVSAIQLSVDMRERQPRKEDYRVEVQRAIDQTLCPGCTIQHLSPQSAVDVAVRSRKRVAIDPESGADQPAAATSQLQEPRSAPAAQAKPAEPPAARNGTPDGPGRTG